MKTCFIETHIEPLGEDDKATELNFSKLTLNKKGQFSQQGIIPNVLPRFQTFSTSSTILEMKKEIYERIKHAFPQPDED